MLVRPGRAEFWLARSLPLLISTPFLELRAVMKIAGGLAARLMVNLDEGDLQPRRFLSVLITCFVEVTWIVLL